MCRFRRTSRSVMTACVSCSTRMTVALATLSSIASTAGRVIRLLKTCLMTAPAPVWPALSSAPTAPANTATPLTAATTLSPSPVPSAVRGFGFPMWKRLPAALERGRMPRPQTGSHNGTYLLNRAKLLPSKVSAASIWPVMR